MRPTRAIITLSMSTLQDSEVAGKTMKMSSLLLDVAGSTSPPITSPPARLQALFSSRPLEIVMNTKIFAAINFFVAIWIGFMAVDRQISRPEHFHFRTLNTDSLLGSVEHHTAQ